MRTAIIVDAFPSRTETFIIRHINGLNADVLAVSMDESDMKGWANRPYVACQFYKQRKKKEIINRIIDRVKELTIGLPAPRWSPAMQKICENYLKERKPDVVLAEFAPNGMCAMEVCEKYCIPLVVHFHGYDASSLLRIKNYRELLPVLFRKSSAIVVVSRWMRDLLIEMGCRKSKLHVIPCGAPVDEFMPSDKVMDQPCNFITVSSFTPMKGTLYTIKAFSLCAKRCENTTLTMIGDGKEYKKAKELVRKLRLINKISLIGSQSIETVYEYLKKSCVFLQHSITTPLGHKEGWGVSIAEAAATGLPIVSTDHGGISDHVVNGKTGFLVQEGDWKAMAKKMILLANNPGLRNKMGTAGRHNIEQTGNAELQIQKLRQVLKTASVSN